MLSRYAWPVVGLLWIAYAINYVDRQVVFSIFPALRSELHFSDAELALTGTVFTWVYSLCMPLTGRIADVMRRDRVVLMSLLLWSLATCGTGLSHSVPMFLFWRAMVGITESLYVPAALSLIAGFHFAATRSQALAIHATAQFAGVALGGWYGGWAADHVGWRMGFFVLTAIGFGYAALLAGVFQKLPRVAGPERRAPSSPREILMSRSYLALVAAFLAFGMMIWMLYAWLAIFIYERYGLSMTESGFTATVYLQSGSAAGVLAGGVLGDRFGRRFAGGRFYVGGTGLLLCAPFAYLLFSGGSLAFVKFCSVAFGLLGGLFIANLFAAAYDVISERNYGFGAGMLNMAGGLSGGAAIFAAGWWKTSIGVNGLMRWTASASAVLAVVLVAVVAKNFKKDRIAAA